MRLAILAILLLLLLAPSLYSAVAAPAPVTLRPTAGHPAASGSMRVVARDDQVKLTVDARGLPVRPVYVVWLVDAERRLVNLGTLPIDARGNGTRSFSTSAVTPTYLILAISAEPHANVVAPDRRRDSVVLVGESIPSGAGNFRRLTRDFGPAWFVPILPAALGLSLIRGARRLTGPLAPPPHDFTGSPGGSPEPALPAPELARAEYSRGG